VSRGQNRPYTIPIDVTLSEGWATGIPTIQNELEKNG